MENTPFDQLITGEVPVLVDFHAEWCGPCKALAPELDKLKKSLGDALRIVKVDVDRNPEIAARLGVRGVPTMVLFRDGEPVWRQTGAQPAPALEQALRRFLVKAA